MRIASLVGLLVLCGCSSARDDGPPSTNTTSSAFATLPEKVAFLERYVTFRRHYRELEYAVFYHNNGGGLVPGPSDWDVTIIARVPPEELGQWTSETKRVQERPPELAKVASALDLSGVDEWYASMSKAVGIDRKNAVVMYRVQTH